MINGLATLKAFLQALMTIVVSRVSSTSQPTIQTAVPIDNGCQVKKSMLHWNVCNVNRPCLIGTVCDCITKQIWTDFCLLHALRQIYLWVNQCNVHFTHISACFTATNLIYTQFKLSRHLTGSPCRIVRMQMVKDSFAFQFFF